MEIAKPRKDWFGRNWKWFLPITGLGVLIFCAGCIAAFFFLIFGTLKSSTPYQQALTKVRASPAAQQALGTPIQDGWIVTGSIEESGNSGTATFSIPVSGPKGSGTVNMTAVKSFSGWRITKLELVVKGSNRSINLLTGQ